MRVKGALELHFNNKKKITDGGVILPVLTFNKIEITNN